MGKLLDRLWRERGGKPKQAKFFPHPEDDHRSAKEKLDEFRARRRAIEERRAKEEKS